jgi:hypothetical protein
MILTRKGGPHRDRREKRSNNPKNQECMKNHADSTRSIHRLLW